MLILCTMHGLEHELVQIGIKRVVNCASRLHIFLDLIVQHEGPEEPLPRAAPGPDMRATHGSINYTLQATGNTLVRSDGAKPPPDQQHFPSDGAKPPPDVHEGYRCPFFSFTEGSIHPHIFGSPA